MYACFLEDDIFILYILPDLLYIFVLEYRLERTQYLFFGEMITYRDIGSLADIIRE